ncbi:ribosomal protein S18 acetylase RimI-like enzyme [Rhodopseudomonas julia]|uniref:Ribosomal protein S18 acetylase RimI-like enzyme n=1 Tax=Rhodopseudomonas julia TaxID=200617 RepID=A0ABU0C7V6_9BRAD|nr:GNAT family N-acetyltransferase [Rhodopseudomonas julia]MDQ0325147.1 ribosomal protein S18 acetylase RimI-like enzyme [Rhodopseudomonas julia]
MSPLEEENLRRPIWTALATRHAHLAEGGAGARRYPADISPFAASGDDCAESLAALERLCRLGERMVFLQRDPVALPEGFAVALEADGVQMVGEGPFPRIEDARIVPLGPDDAEAMLALAELTKPGPFSLKAQRLGRFWGVKENGRLIAMAGERLKLPGMTELSGLCTRPEVQGRGLGRLLLAFVAGEIVARGERVFLHAFASNENAIRLYETAGFRLHTHLHVVMAEKA